MFYKLNAVNTKGFLFFEIYCPTQFPRLTKGTEGEKNLNSFTTINDVYLLVGEHKT